MPDLSIDGLISGDVHINAPGSTAIGHVVNTASPEMQTELDRQFGVAKCLIAGSVDKENKLLNLLKNFNKEMI